MLLANFTEFIKFFIKTVFNKPVFIKNIRLVGLPDRRTLDSFGSSSDFRTLFNVNLIDNYQEEIIKLCDVFVDGLFDINFFYFHSHIIYF